MKMTDVNENLREAPDFKAGAQKFKTGAKKLGKTTKLKLQKQTPFSKHKRGVATAKDKTRMQAKSIKKAFMVWMASAEDEGTTPTAENFINYITDEQSDLAPFVKDVGKAFGFLAPPKKKAVAGDFESQPSAGKEKTSKEEKTGKKKRKLSPEEQAGYDKIAKGAEEEAAEKEKQDVKASKGDDKEPKVDTSASIYEDRFAAMLYERKLSDNDIDTYIVRLLQAKKKGGAKAALATATDQEQPAAQEPEQPAKPKGKEPKVSDGGKVKDDDEDVFKIDNNYRRPLEEILRNVMDSKEQSAKAPATAKQILNRINYHQQN